jgi:hypothetical protein
LRAELRGEVGRGDVTVGDVLREDGAVGDVAMRDAAITDVGASDLAGGVGAAAERDEQRDERDDERRCVETTNTVEQESLFLTDGVVARRMSNPRSNMGIFRPVLFRWRDRVGSRLLVASPLAPETV